MQDKPATQSNIEEFVQYASKLTGDEKGEAQVFCDRLFKAFGHEGYKEAGATLEFRVRSKIARTKFADLVWKPRLLLEMKKSSECLDKHYRQAFEYWQELVPHRPRYVVLCNFKEFWIYDFDLQLDDPMDKVSLQDLPRRYSALSFLFPIEEEPLFGNDRVAVTRKAADKIATIFNSLTSRGEDRKTAQRFLLQCVFSMFAEDFGLLPKNLFTKLVHACKKGASTYDRLGNLFRQMDNPKQASAGEYKLVQYFNGGLFSEIDPVELNSTEIEFLIEALSEDWSKVQPPIFGTLFQSSMDQQERHAYGAHFTSEADIQRIITPTIVKPWRKDLEKASSLTELIELLRRLRSFTVLDPACGSGNFLYVAYLEVKRIELDILAKIQNNFKLRLPRHQREATTLSVNITQFFGMDLHSFPVELAKVTMLIAKSVSMRIIKEQIPEEGMQLSLDRPLPLDNLDDNILCTDALFSEWPKANAIIGNPPYQSKNKMQQEYGRTYLNRLRTRYPDIPGRADYCVYWFRRAHDELPAGGRAGLVGTNTIRQNYSREGGLDYIVSNGGVITEAVSSQVWSGEAVVHVSIVNWIKGHDDDPKKLYNQLGDNIDSPWEVTELERINSALSPRADVSCAKKLTTNLNPKVCYQGQTHGHKGFLLSPIEAHDMVKHSAKNAEVIFPYLIGEDFLKHYPPLHKRYVIDFHPRDVVSCATYSLLFDRIKKQVLPDIKATAYLEKTENAKTLNDDPYGKVNRDHQNFLNKWWLLFRPRAELIEKIRKLPRYIICGRVTKRPIFEFAHSSINPNDMIIAFLFPDDYSFGILQSEVHCLWFTARCSTLKRDPRYTNESIFSSFPWPQFATLEQIQKVAEASVNLWKRRRKLMDENRMSLRSLYRLMELPGSNILKEASRTLDDAVRDAYGIGSKEDILHFLLKLNLEIAKREAGGKPVMRPGLPDFIENRNSFITDHCIQPLQLC